MKPAFPGLAWVPPLAVGMTLAAAAEISGVLLLYSGPGLLQALTIILAVQAGSVALGLWVAGRVGRSRVVEAIRRRWLFALVALSAAAVTAGVWAVVGGFSDSRLGQGLGLAVLSGLPLYGTGGVAGLLDRPQAGLRPRREAFRPRPHVLVVLGAGLGFLLTGVLLIRGLAPTSIFLGAIVLLSGGALAHARLLRPDPAVRTVEERSTSVGIVRVEDRVSRRDGGRVRLLRVNGRIRGGEHGDGRPALSDERRVLRAVGELTENPGHVLVVGTGAGTLVRQLLRVSPGARVDAVEESSEILSLARKHFPALPEAAAHRVRILEGRLRRPPRLHGEGYDLIVVDAGALDPGRPAPGLEPDEIEGFHALLAEGGRLMVWRLAHPERAGDSLDALLTSVREWLPDVELRHGAGGGGEADLEAMSVEDEGPGALLVATRRRGEEAKEMTRQFDEEAGEDA